MKILCGVSILLAITAGFGIHGGHEAPDIVMATTPTTLRTWATFGSDGQATYCSFNAALIKVESNSSNGDVAVYTSLTAAVPIGTGLVVYVLKEGFQKSEYRYQNVVAGNHLMVHA